MPGTPFRRKDKSPFLCVFSQLLLAPHLSATLVSQVLRFLLFSTALGGGGGGEGSLHLLLSLDSPSPLLRSFGR